VAAAFCQLACQHFDASINSAKTSVVTTVPRVHFGLVLLKAAIMRAKACVDVGSMLSMFRSKLLYGLRYNAQYLLLQCRSVSCLLS